MYDSRRQVGMPDTERISQATLVRIEGTYGSALHDELLAQI